MHSSYQDIVLSTRHIKTGLRNWKGSLETHGLSVLITLVMKAASAPRLLGSVSKGYMNAFYELQGIAKCLTQLCGNSLRTPMSSFVVRELELAFRLCGSPVSVTRA